MHGLLSILSQDSLLFIAIAVSLLLSITVHEFSHAYVACKLGDSTAKSLGRMSLNPLVHLDPIGTLTLLLVGFGWGKAVPVNYYNLKNPKRDAMLISLAGPVSNFIMAVSMAVLIKVVPSSVSAFIYPIVLYNIILGVFNLIPVEPLDGFKVVNGLLPPKLSVQWVQLAPYGLYILILLVITGTTSAIIYPTVNLFMSFLRL